MVKYTNTKVVFEEIPEMISLAVNISNCQNHCIGCHSTELLLDIGNELNEHEIDKLISSNDGINCFIFMGEGNDKNKLISLAKYIKETYPAIKVAIYSGRDDVDNFYYEIFDYIKIGRYSSMFGPLNKPTTNQKLFMKKDKKWIDITNKFWR